MADRQLSDSVALHTAARRFAIEREKILDSDHQGHADAKDGVRCSAVGCILEEVEKLDPANLRDLASTREQVISAARTAGGQHEADFIGTSIAVGEVREKFVVELEAFCTYVTGLSRSDLAAVEPLPFRRFIENTEAKELWARVTERWDPWTILGNYRPLLGPCSSDVLVLEERAFFEAFDASVLRSILALHGVARVWRFTWRCDEFDDDDLVGYELDLPLITPDIGWDSWASPELDWVIHVRQAGRAAMIGGWLSKAVTSRWPSWRDHMA